MNIKIVAIAFHRNGICGLPFHAVLFQDQGPEESRKLAILFEQSGHCAVLDVAQFAAGDTFETSLRTAINQRTEQ